MERRAGDRRRRDGRQGEGQAGERPDNRQRGALMAAAREIAPAKLNLALHVRGKLPDGRHAIETIFAFCTDGDWLSVEEGDELTLQVSGPFGGDVPEGDENLVLKAARALLEAAGVDKGAKITLEKKLPLASGIGG